MCDPTDRGRWAYVCVKPTNEPSESERAAEPDNSGSDDRLVARHDERQPDRERSARRQRGVEALQGQREDARALQLSDRGRHDDHAQHERDARVHLRPHRSTHADHSVVETLAWP